MGSNILNAIRNIEKFHNNDLSGYSSKYKIQINAAGEQLEFYMKDAFAGSFKDKLKKKEAEHSKTFSYLGNQNNPPDMILKGGDAFEIKKIEGAKSALALNSSPPKDRLHYSDPLLLEACRNCEGSAWREKDLFYVVGHAHGGKIKYLFFVHGLCYAAEHEVYARVASSLQGQITSVINSLELEGGETNELGKVRRVDPLGITELRIRGMWQIQNPVRVFSSICQLDESKKFSLIALMKKEKFNSFPKSDILALQKSKAISIKDVKVKNPNNPAKNIDAKLILLGW